jgi:hypothetical protein
MSQADRSRILSIPLFIAWAAVATQLLFLPTVEIKANLKAKESMLDSMKTAEPALLKIPQVAETIKDAQDDISDPTAFSIFIWLKWVIWLKWALLLFLVLAGFWSAYLILRGRRYAPVVVIIVSLLFLIRQIIISHTIYKMVLTGSNPISVLWRLEVRSSLVPVLESIALVARLDNVTVMREAV